MTHLDGTLFIIAAPSGAGKTSLVKALAESTPNMCVSVSHTTRMRRSGEEDGINYHFVELQTFQKMIEKNAFLEHAEVFGNFYGTSREWVESKLVRGLDVILEIDWQGAKIIRQNMPQAITIFILPPSLSSLQNRLERREQDAPEIIKKRMSLARNEISHYKEFNYLVLNDDFSHAVSDLKTIILAQRFLREKQESRYAKLIEDLLN